MLDAIKSHDGMDRLLDAAEALSGMPLRTIAALGPDEDLADTRAAQPLLYLADWAWGSQLLAAGAKPAAVAGHSLGEFSALAIAGVYSVEAGLELVVERSRLMASVAQANPGGMAAVLGLDGPVVAATIAEIDGAYVANDNCPGQVVVSGTEAGLSAASEALVAAGAKRVITLKVAGPFHSPLMAAAADAFAGDVLQGAEFVDAKIPVLQNTDPTPATDATRIKERLVGQIVSPVRWTETMDALLAMDVTTIVEAGPGAVLKGLARKVDGLTAISVEEAGIAAVMEEVA
jgi:[acyl-carrier-protein] S-malonyltransferase